MVGWRYVERKISKYGDGKGRTFIDQKHAKELRIKARVTPGNKGKL